MTKRHDRFLCMALALSIPPALAQTPTSDGSPTAAAPGVRVYAPEFFAPFAPISALEMAERVPGFVVDNARSERGFGANAGNVLIDGSRPSTKSDDIRAILSRIPAGQVLRIELIERAGGSADADGRGQVLNIVRKSGKVRSGTYEMTVSTDESGDTRPSGQISASFEGESVQYSVGAQYQRNTYNLGGVEDFIDADGSLLRRQPFALDDQGTDVSLTASMRRRAGSAELGVNGKVVRESYVSTRDSTFVAPDGAFLGSELLTTGRPTRRSGFELGADLELATRPGSVTKLVALYSRFNTLSRGEMRRSSSGVSPQITPLLQDTRNRDRAEEAILRVQSDLSLGERHALRFGVEAVRNRLRADFSSASGGLPPLPAANVVVSESRIEPFVSDVWTLNPRWKLDTALIAETSRLKVGGSESAERRFVFWKPRAISTWTPDPATVVELRVERRVAQLDFNDFATSVDLGAGGLVDAGNARLVPQRTSTVSATVRRTVGDRGSVQINGWSTRIDDAQDLVPIVVRDDRGRPVSTVDGPGNIGRGREWGAKLDMTLPIDRFLRSEGVGEMTLKYAGTYRRSRVNDPTTGRSRALSGQAEQTHRLSWRHDLAQAPLAWGLGLDWSSQSTRYFVDRTTRFGETPELSGFVEYRGWEAGKLRLEIDNATESDIFRERVFYAGSRASDIVAGGTKRNMTRDTRLLVTFSGTF